MNKGKDKLKGGLSDKMNKADIAKKFKVTLQKITKELEMGGKVEMEHVKSKSLAKEIAMDHLVEIPDYYTRLKKMEKEAKQKWKVDESTKNNIKRLFREHVELNVTDETTDSTTYTIRYNDRDAGQIAVASKEDMEEAIELVYLELNPDYNYLYLKIITEVIHAIFKEYIDFETILMTPTPESRAFWARMGAKRLNDVFMMIQRSH